MAIPAINYAGNVSSQIRSKGLEVYSGLYASKGVRLTHIWGKGASGDHAKGTALDFMVFNNAAAGHWIANYLMANAERLGVRYIMWNHRIWNVDKDRYGAWRWVPDRGNSTENHMDHVHVAFKSTGGTYVGPNKAPSPSKPAPIPSGSKPVTLKVDGSFGKATITRLQQHIAKAYKSRIVVDGSWGPSSKMYLETVLNYEAKARGWSQPKVTKTTAPGKNTLHTARLRWLVGRNPAAGAWDTETTKALQRFLNSRR